MRRKVAIMGGSFNPVHIGHLMLANYIRQEYYLDSVMLVLSPLNPLKENPAALLPDDVRFEMLKIACEGIDFLEVSDVELSLPRPSYTINTLRYLSQKFTDTDFTLIIGADNWEIFDKWRSSEEIIQDYGVLVYPRPGYVTVPENTERVKFSRAPMFDISSTFIRNLIASGGDPMFFVPQGVRNYIIKHNLYK